MANHSPARKPVSDWDDEGFEYRTPTSNGRPFTPSSLAAKKPVPTPDSDGFGLRVPRRHGRPYPTYPNMQLATKKSIAPTSDETLLRQKLLEAHAHDGGATFDTEPLLASIEGIIHHVTQGVDFTSSNPTKHVETFPTNIQATGPDAIFDDMDYTLPHLLHKIICMLNCECSGGDGHALSMEILQLLANYTWEAKIVIVLASFVVEFGQHSLVAMLNSTNPLAKLLATVKQIPYDISNVMKAKFETIIRLVKVSMEVTRFIAKFGCFPSKYISNDAEPMAVALSHIPVAVYWMIRVVVACASEHSQILGQTEITTSYTETWNITTLEQKITTIQTTFTTQLDLCDIYIEETKQYQYYEKLKVMFGQTTVYVDNQKILQAIINTKDGSRPLSCGSDLTTVGLEVLKGKTVLLLISDLEISNEEMIKIVHFYQESRTKAEFQYEIVWLPIVGQIKEYEQKFVDLKCKMPWYALEHPNLLKPGVVRYVKEEWRYTKKSIMVALDQRGKVAHHNALHMMWIWGNAVYPFTYRRELDLWSRKEWSLTLLVEQIDQNISKWIKEDKVICLYGGEDYDWIENFIAKAGEVADEADIDLQMVYVCKKNTRKEHITKITEIHAGRGVVVWESTTSTYFWKRIECMMYSKVHHGARVATENDSGDQILAEVLNMLTLGDSDAGWALISQGAGSGPGEMVSAKGDVILNMLVEFESWSVGVKQMGFTRALHDYLTGRPMKEHHCNRLILPGIEDIPGIVVCAECHRPMEKYIMYRCCIE